MTELKAGADSQEMLEILDDCGRVIHCVSFSRATEKAGEALEHELLASDREEVEWLVRLAARLFTLPNYEFIRRRALELGMMDLPSTTTTKVAWVMRSLVNVLNEVESERGTD